MAGTETDPQAVARAIRSTAARWALDKGGGYLGQACGVADLLGVLYTRILDLGPSLAPLEPPRFRSVPSPGSAGIRGEDWLGGGPDLMVVSPAHYATAQYGALIGLGRLDERAVREHSDDGGLLEMIGAEHSPGMAVTSGSLGTALSVTVGRALGRRLQRRDGRLWALLSDGEFQEGITFEALQAAVAHALDNLRVVVDVNRMQVDGPTAEVFPSRPIADRLRAVGWQVWEVEGHDLEAIEASARLVADADGPAALLARTTPWTGFPSLRARWETGRLHFVRLSPDEAAHLERELIAL
jgi:transketolase